MNWKLTTLGEISLKVQSGGTPKTTIAEYYGGNINWVKTKEVNFCKIYSTEVKITPLGLKNSSAKMIPENSVLVAMYGNGDTAGRCAMNMIPVATNQACCNFTFNESIAHPFFMFYKISNHYLDFVHLKSGGAQLNLNGKTLKEFKIELPPLPTQKRIADILTAYDDLTENNLKRIKLLEQAAQNIYKEWFVNMRFPGHENTSVDQETGLPEGWEKINLYDFSEIQMGYAFKAKDFNNEMEGKPAIRIRDILSSWTKTYTKVTVSDKYLVSNGDILIGMDGIFHMDIWSGQENALLVQRVCRLRAKNENLQGYLLQALRHPIKFYEKTISGATVAHLGAKHLKEIFVSLPKGDIEDKLTLFNDFNSQIVNLNKQNQKLKAARDILLPRLMNQTIEV